MQLQKVNYDGQKLLSLTMTKYNSKYIAHKRRRSKSMKPVWIVSEIETSCDDAGMVAVFNNSEAAIAYKEHLDAEDRRNNIQHMINNEHIESNVIIGMWDCCNTAQEQIEFDGEWMEEDTCHNQQV
jgi:hypothetical protein